jgi:hypothetical protein
MEELLSFVQAKILENFPEVRWDIVFTIQMVSFLVFRLLGSGTPEEPKWLSRRKAKTFTTLFISIIVIIFDAIFEHLNYSNLSPGYFKIMINSYILATSMYELGLFAVVSRVNTYLDIAEKTVQEYINKKDILKRRK